MTENDKLPVTELESSENNSQPPILGQEEITQNDEVAEMSLLEHLEELRKRLVRAVVAIFLGMLACVPVSKQIFNYIMLPLFNSLPKKIQL